jgi:hypothetical protein
MHPRQARALPPLSILSTRYLVAPNTFTFPRAAEVLREGPLGAQLAWRLPGRRPAPRWLLSLLADVAGIERCRLE